MCNCSKDKSNETVVKSNSVKSPNSGGRKPKTAKIVSGNSPAPKTMVVGVCAEMYDDLRILDKKTYDLFKRTRQDRDSDGYQWLEIQRSIRKWIAELHEKCPDEEKLNVIRELINQEYTKLF